MLWAIGAATLPHLMQKHPVPVRVTLCWDHNRGRVHGGGFGAQLALELKLSSLEPLFELLPTPLLAATPTVLRNASRYCHTRACVYVLAAGWRCSADGADVRVVPPQQPSGLSRVAEEIVFTCTSPADASAWCAAVRDAIGMVEGTMDPPQMPAMRRTLVGDEAVRVMRASVARRELLSAEQGV